MDETECVTAARDAKLLNAVQEGIEFVERPFEALGRRVGMTEAKVIAALKKAKSENIIRQISAIYDSRQFGYKSTLVAAKVAQEHLQQVADLVSAHPGVSHNYERTHEFNLWFTIAVPPESNLDLHLGIFRIADGVNSLRKFPTVKLFKIGVKLDVSGEDSPMERDSFGIQTQDAHAFQITDSIISIVRATQEDMEIVPDAFDRMANAAGISTAELLDSLNGLKSSGALRRFAAVLRHRKAGFGANMMSVWNVPPEQIEALGPKIASVRAVSHCYQRTTYPDWRYSVFAMIHARTTEECEAVARHISQETEITDYAGLYSTREFKKVRVKYFDRAIKNWEAKFLAA